ncbi:uncharacterized protein LOC135420513 isoform X9 [Pseudopipra pipra]|uniref:uncharacterized protein LOC135420513 isoform X9 n=1 Tax=Pseudopipra pipra TaxID=415032 RepID=UPI003139643C
MPWKRFPSLFLDENTGNASPLDWLHKVLQPLQPPAGVSAGRTFPAPLLVPRPKLLSHGRGPPRGKSQPPGEKKTQMDQGAVHKLMFPEGSSGSVPGSAEGREAMPGTGTRAENTGNASPLDWLRKVLGPLQPPARVSAGRTFPAPLLVASPKLLSHGRGPPRGKSQPPGEKKTLESNEVLKEIMKELQKGREMDQGALWQAAFPEGSSGSVPGSAAGREAMPGTGTRDEGAGNASPLDWLHEVLEPLQPPAVTGVSAGRTFPAPLLLVPYKLNSHHRGPPGGKSQPPGKKKSQEPSEGTRQMLKEVLQAGPEMDQGALWQAAFPKGSSGSVPGSAEGREAMPGTGTRDAAGATTRAPKIQESAGRDFCRGTRCLIVIMASMLGGLLVIMSCCAGIWYWRVRKRQESSLAPAPEQPNTSGRKSRTSHPHSLYPCSAALPRLQHLLFDVKVQLPSKRSSLPLNPLIAPYDED